MRATKLLLGACVVLAAVSLHLLGLLTGANLYLDGKVRTNRTVHFHGPSDAQRIQTDIANVSRDKYPQATREVRSSAPNPPISDDYKAWERDIWSREFSRERMLGKGPSLHRPIDFAHREDPFTILIVGDSFSYGLFHELTDMNYTRRLEQLLNKAGGGSYKVVVLAADQSSFLRQSDWVTADKIREIGPDMVIATHTMNRLHPTFLENKYCVEFNTCITDGQDRPFYDEQGHDFARSSEKWRIIMCLRADKTPVSTVLRKFLYPHFPNVAEVIARNYCTTERVLAGVDLPTERTGATEEAAQSPYIGDFATYLERIKTAVDAQPTPPALHVVNLAWTPDYMWPPLNVDGKPHESLVRSLIEMYQQAGFEEIPTPSARDAISRLETWRLGDVGGGGGNGLTLNTCVFNCEMTPEQWESNKKNWAAGAINHTLKFRPGNTIQAAVASDIFNFVQQRYPLEASVPADSQPLVVDYTPWALYVDNSAGNARISRSSKLGDKFGKDSGSGVPPDHMWALCARIDHPHASLALNQERVDRAEGLKVAYNGGAYSKVLVSFESELPDGNVKLRSSVELRPGEYFVLKRPQGVRNIYVSDPSQKCTAEVSILKHFEITVDLVQ